MTLVANFAARLDRINETQESINALSKYMLANESASAELIEVWKSRITHTLSDTTKLLLIYLCNDVVQQAKRQNKTLYIHNFSKIIPQVISPIYGAAESTIKSKINRVVDVWQQRSVFAFDYIESLRKSLNSASASAKATPTAAKSSSSVIPELRHINDLFQHINDLTEISQGNLTQLGIQSKTYLNLASDNLPKTHVHLSKLNVLEKLSKVSINNIEEIKTTRENIKDSLDTLVVSLVDGIKSDESKMAIIRDKIKKIHEVRQKLQVETEPEKHSGDKHPEKEHPGGRGGQEKKEKEEEEEVEEEEEEEEEDLPKYEEDDEEEEEEDTEDDRKVKKRKMSSTPSGGSTPNRKVAFAENIEVNEFEVNESNDEEKSPEHEFPEKTSLEVMDLLSKLA
ncbi:RTT103 [Candida oxycetoniae]|uniref:RTT103 n=1 Tax=Candida oxycetoniae TaxID=497107 RepID=A0AAI9X020_9ASCO|nr:RTT103 [Candida oxycetoniae]KAI3407016.2 RTT103 [Candida oxycetoniae]